jgi:VCBS repeat-containing protein
VAVTDTDGDRTAAANNLVITIRDDAPTAAADTDSVAAGQLTAETGNVITGVGTTSALVDVQGADGAVVAGVAAGNTGADLVNSGTVGAAIAGAFGTLTLNADGSYSYAHTGAPGGGTDVFTYTIKDADGDVSHTTLTIAVADSSPANIVVPAADGADTTVSEGGLPARGGEPAGSNPVAPITASGTITFTSPWGFAAARPRAPRLLIWEAREAGRES